MPPALPEELIELIVIASLPPEIYSDEYSARYEILRRYSLVSRLWRTMAQREMFRYIYIPTVESANLLDTSPLRDKKREELLQPRAVRFGRYIDQDEDAGYYTSARWLDHVLLRFSNVGHVIVSHFGLETPFDFYAFTDCTTLTLHWIELVGDGLRLQPPQAPPSLSSLTRLQLVDVYLDRATFGPWSHLISKRTLPNVWHLAVHSFDPLIDGPDEADKESELAAAIADFMPQLRTLHISTWVNTTVIEALPLCPAMRELYIAARSCNMLEDGVLVALPPRLERLLVSPEVFASEQWQDVDAEERVGDLDRQRVADALVSLALEPAGRKSKRRVPQPCLSTLELISIDCDLLCDPPASDLEDALNGHLPASAIPVSFHYRLESPSRRQPVRNPLLGMWESMLSGPYMLTAGGRELQAKLNEISGSRGQDPLASVWLG